VEGLRVHTGCEMSSSCECTQAARLAHRHAAHTLRWAERCREAEGGLRVVTILEVGRCREAEGGLRDVARLKVRGEMSRFWRLRDAARLKVG